MARAAMLPDGVTQAAQQTEEALNAPGVLERVAGSLPVGGCGARCTRYGCPAVQVLQCYDASAEQRAAYTEYLTRRRDRQ